MKKKQKIILMSLGLGMAILFMTVILGGSYCLITKRAEANSTPQIVLKGQDVKVKFVGQLPNGAKPVSIWGYFYGGGWHLAVGDDKSNIWSLEWESPKK